MKLAAEEPEVKWAAEEPEVKWAAGKQAAKRAFVLSVLHCC